jgi:hydrogenase maturation factor
MPTANELIAHGREVEEVCKLIGADGLIFQDLEDLEEAVREINPELRHFETSVFNGHYVTSDVDQVIWTTSMPCAATTTRRCASGRKGPATSRSSTKAVKRFQIASVMNNRGPRPPVAWMRLRRN